MDFGSGPRAIIAGALRPLPTESNDVDRAESFRCAHDILDDFGHRMLFAGAHCRGPPSISPGHRTHTHPIISGPELPRDPELLLGRSEEHPSLGRGELLRGCLSSAAAPCL